MSDTNTVKEIKNIIRLFGASLSEDELAEVNNFVDNDEYELAIETLCFIIIEETKSIPNGVIDRIRKLPFADSLQDGLLDKVEEHSKRM
jgi:uncharacterized protein with HEPN domain